MSEDREEKMIFAAVALLVGLLNLPFEGFVIAKSWLWFAVPLGAPPITWAHGSTITLVFALVAFRYEDRGKESGEKMLTRAFSALAVSVSTLGLVALLHWMAQS
jgi:hypothetical protein